MDLTVMVAAKLMSEQKVSSIAIEHGGKKHIFSMEDLLEFVHAGGDLNTPLHETPIHMIDCLSEAERVLVAFELMERAGRRHLGVTDQAGNLVGIVTYSDILHSIDPSVLMERKTVGDIVARSAPVMFTADWILEDVAHHIKKQEDSIIVVESGRAVGIITAQDIFGLVTSGAAMDQSLAYYMTSPVITTPVNFSISNALLQLREFNIKRAIVVDEQDRVVGVLKQSELVGFAYGSWVNLIKSHTAELHELVEILEQRTRSLEKLTVTDVLTGLGNRRMLHLRMLEEIERMRRYGGDAFSLVILDIDRFKLINDKHGHLIGDEILKVIAGIMESLVRKTDTAVRWGGEEFAVLLANTKLVDATLFANRLREMVEHLSYQDDVSVSISAGVGEYSVNEDESSFFQRVDRALYRAKAQGRNLVEVDAGMES
ncbi:GGDEF domain-containing protein [Ferriphaselus amnicola]|nr:GGDEF domain-containing protein [Ferriphaselus amnicola]